MYYGAAPLKESTRQFFVSINLPIINGYGLSETSAAVTMQEFPCTKLEKAGKPLPGTQIKIFNPDEKGIGEICMKGRHVFMGYLDRE